MRSESVYCIGDVHAWGEGTVGGRKYNYAGPTTANSNLEVG